MMRIKNKIARRLIDWYRIYDRAGDVTVFNSILQVHSYCTYSLLFKYLLFNLFSSHS